MGGGSGLHRLQFWSLQTLPHEKIQITAMDLWDVTPKMIISSPASATVERMAFLGKDHLGTFLSRSDPCHQTCDTGANAQNIRLYSIFLHLSPIASLTERSKRPSLSMEKTRFLIWVAWPVP